MTVLTMVRIVGLVSGFSVTEWRLWSGQNGMVMLSESFQHEGQIDMNDKDLKGTSRTNWAALEVMQDEDIDYSDIPPLTDAFFERAILRVPADQAQRLVQLDPDVMRWFQAQGGEYRSRINSVLRRHIEDDGERSA